jgi:hypothetical protein
MYGMLIEEIARARHEERMCGIPGPRFRRSKRRPKPEATSPTPPRRDETSIRSRTPVQV